MYGPNRDSPDFYRNLLNILITFENQIIMAGNFNLVLSQETDTYSYTDLNNPRVRSAVLDIITQNKLNDMWAGNEHGKKRVYMV